MSDIKRLNQAIDTIAQYFHEPSDAENGNRFAKLQDRMLFNVCDTLAGNINWVLNTGMPGAQRRLSYAERGSVGGEIDQLEIDNAKEYLKVLADQVPLADAALEQAMAKYTRYTGKDYVWVAYADRKAGVKSTTTDAASATLDKYRAKYGIKA